ncbi:unnamed protein product [Clavelina lepadiformis]|uniref:Heparanase n=1 Tax=Clavelina lepadiformis TaxID=159417 RepID=A0ABP0FDE3_CLALP
MLKCIALWFLSLAWNSSASKIRFFIDTSVPVHVVNPLSPSVAMGLGIFEYRWVDYFRDEKFLTLARGLGPSYLRVGGTKADFITFYQNDEDRVSSYIKQRSLVEGSEHQCQQQLRDEEVFQAHRKWADAQQLLFKEEKRKFGIRQVLKPLKMTAADWDKLNEFCQCVGWKLVFGLNLLKRDGEVWNSTNAEQLLQYTEYKYNVNWELGNEPDSYFHKTGISLSAEQVGDAFLRLKDILQKSGWWNSSMILGPDANRIGTRSAGQFLKNFLETAASTITGVTFHQYYLNGKTATPEEFLNKTVLNSIIPKLQQVRKIVQRTAHGRPLWLGETASAFGGGAPGMSNSFIDGFTWLDKLGMASKMGVDMVIRQSFIQSNYDLVDSNFDPLPDYWLTLIYKRLVGPQVLNVTLQKCLQKTGSCRSVTHGHFRMYAHCTKSTVYPHGSVVIYFINLKPKPVKVTMKPLRSKVAKPELFLLEPGVPGNLTSNEVRLNGKLLRLTSAGTFPPLQPTYLHPRALTKGFRIPGHSFGFLALNKFRANACFQE